MNAWIGSVIGAAIAATAGYIVLRTQLNHQLSEERRKTRLAKLEETYLTIAELRNQTSDFVMKIANYLSGQYPINESSSNQRITVNKLKMLFSFYCPSLSQNYKVIEGLIDQLSKESLKCLDVIDKPGRERAIVGNSITDRCEQIDRELNKLQEKIAEYVQTTGTV